MRGGPQQNVKQREKLFRIRQEFEGEWGTQRILERAERELCRCTEPSAGPRYFGETRCVKCQGVIEGLATRPGMTGSPEGG